MLILPYFGDSWAVHGLYVIVARIYPMPIECDDDDDDAENKLSTVETSLGCYVEW